MLTSEQIRAARAMLRIDQRDLAERSGISLETIKRIERTPGVVSSYTSTMAAIQRALEAAGVEFTDGDRPGVRLQAPAAPASKSKAAGDRSAGPARAGTKKTPQ